MDITPPGSHASLEVQVGNLSIPGSIGNLSSISGVDEVDRLSNSGCNTDGDEVKQRLCFTKSTDLGIHSFSKEKLRRHSDGTSITVKSPPEEPLIREALLRVSLDGPSNPKEAEQDGLSGKLDHYADVERWAHQVKHHFQIQESSEGFGSKTFESGRTSQHQNDLNILEDGADMNQNTHNSSQNKCISIEDGYREREGEGSGSPESNPSVDGTPHVGLDDFLHEPEKKLDILEGLQGRITSTPASKLPRQFSLTTTSSIPEGSFQGQGKHKDGNLLG